MSIVYFLSIISLMYVFLIMKKTNKKENIFLWLIITLLLFMCFNSLCIFILSLLNIKSYLILRTFINVSLSLFLYFKLIKRQEHQQYFFEKKDFIAIVVLLLTVCLFGYFRFGKDLSITFSTTDPAAHYLNARLFYENNMILGNTNLETIYGASHNNPSIFFGYTNLGTIMQLVSLFVSEDNMYNVFLIFELFVLFISGLLFYFSIKKNIKLRINNMIFLLVLTLMYILGYPLNNALFGFHYLGLGIMLINLIIILVDYRYNESIKCIKIFDLIVALSTLMLFFSYYLFVPAVYAGVGFYILYQWKVKKNIKFKQAIIDIIKMLVFSFIIGIIYFFVLPKIFANNSTSPATAMTYEGYIYRNLIGNFIFLIPLIVYLLINKFKTKSLDVLSFTFVTVSICTIIFFGLVIIDKASTYYFYKFYYVLWLTMFLMIGEFINSNSQNILLIGKIYVYTYLIIVLLALSGIEEKMNSRHYLLNPYCFSNQLANIYVINHQLLNSESPILTNGKLDIVNYISKNSSLLNEKNEITIQGGTLERLWIYSIKNIISINDYHSLDEYYTKYDSIDEINNNNMIKYFVTFYDSDWYSKNKTVLSKYKVIYSNDSGAIYSK